MIEIIGWIASVALAISSLPVAYAAYKTQHVSTPWSAIFLVLTGMYGMLLYEMFTAAQVPQLVDFFFGALGWSVTELVKLKEDRRKS